MPASLRIRSCSDAASARTSSRIERPSRQACRSCSSRGVRSLPEASVPVIGALPVAQAVLMLVLLGRLLKLEPPNARTLGRLALVAGAALAGITVAIPMQLEREWLTIAWALEGAALAWLYTRIPHRGLLAVCAGLVAIVFVRLALNPAVFVHAPRSATRIWNWYLYTYTIAALACFLAAWLLRRTDDELLPHTPRVSSVLARRRDAAALPARQHRDCGLLLRRTDADVPFLGDARARPHLHARLGRLRAGAARRRHLRATSRAHAWRPSRCSSSPC